MDIDEKTRTLGLDIGTKRTGVALSDPEGILASPFTVIHETQRGAWAQKINEIIAENGVNRVVVGLPLNHHGEAGRDAENIRQAIRCLAARVTVPVIEWDERFTTVQAERALLEGDVSRKKRKDVIDKVAACILLQSFLDHERYQ